MTSQVQETFPIWIEYWCENSTHNHMVLLREANAPSEAESLALLQIEAEDCASELAESVRLCSPLRHKGHGQFHTDEEVQRAFRAGVWQLQNRDFRRDWEEMKRLQRTHKKWGGPVPAALFLPNQDDPNLWQAMIPDSEGNPYIYDIHKGVMEGLIPPPKELGARPNKDGPGWTLPPPSDRRN